MKTLLLVNTGNDADIIKESLQHNERFFDKIIVLDRESKDATVDQVKSLNSDKIVVMDAYYEHAHQFHINSSILESYKNQFDYYIILDADEFIVAENLDELLDIPQGYVGNMPWKCYVPLVDTYSNVKENITMRRTIEPAGCHKIVKPNSTEGIPSLGSHYLHSGNARVPAIDLKTISLAHFPVRSREQYNRKIEFFKNLQLDPSQITHLRNKEKITTLTELREKAINYVEYIENQTLVYDPVKH